jgi:aspartate 1-decarboxylase
MKRIMLKAKIHHARVTETNVNYEGSLSLPADLMDAAGMLPFEKVHVYNVSNGERFSTYLLKGEAGSTTVGVYGAAAHRAHPGHKLIIVCYAILDEEETEFFLPRIILLDAANRIIETR